MFSNCGPLKKEMYKSKICCKWPQECPETIGLHWHRKCLALTFCVLCLLLVLRGILYAGWFHPGDRFIHPPDSVMGGYNITGHRYANNLFVDNIHYKKLFLLLKKVPVRRTCAYRHKSPVYNIGYICAWMHVVMNKSCLYMISTASPIVLISSNFHGKCKYI